MAQFTFRELNLQLSSQCSLLPNPAPFALVVESNTGTVGANSYVSLEYANRYFIGRRLYSSAWITATDDTKIVAIKQASSLLDSEFAWTGTGPLTTTQGLSWPRAGAWDRDYNPVVGVPGKVRDATCELAFYLLASDRLVGRDGVGIKSLKVDVIQIVYDKTDSPETLPSYVARMLLGLGTPLRGGQIRNVKLFRV